MPDNRNWNRPIQVKFFVDEHELELIKTRMAQVGTENMSAYLRKMLFYCFTSTVLMWCFFSVLYEVLLYVTN